MTLKSTFLTLMLTGAVVLSGCSGAKVDNKKAEENHKEKLSVYTTIFPLENFTSLIGGDKVKVKSVYPPNVDAHSYEPTTKTMIEIADADLFIYTGAGVEGFADNAAITLEKEEVKIIKAADGIDLLKNTHDHEHEHADSDEGHNHEHTDGDEGHDHEHTDGDEGHDHEHTDGDEGHDHEHVDGDEGHNHEHADGEDEHHHHHGEFDPHVWLDPIRSIQLAENIKNTLIELSPENKEEFEENFSELKQKLENLDQKFVDTIKQASSKEILVSHAAYGYWEDRYGIEQLPISGLSPTQEPSQKQLQSIIELSKEHKIKYVIFDQNVTSKVAEIIRTELGAETLTLHNLESITEEDITKNEDYFTLMEKNIKTLEKALNN
ncbi:metal ABC transporter solute-binding protein, Zn/Mn family [Cytobacillus sp.]|uniref:metal ABC transporter solute-binding protein, Zn/Mn family n=1 Tax=Cytobacillus sp. TaxID=2675269 RepID=UPI0028BEC96D|nr:zinc ABC transporter substrate-binding protein [Cytobacillus sp.]